MALKKLKQPVILNSTGKPMSFTREEQFHIAYTQKLVNERFGNQLGYEVPITTLTAISKKVSEQKLYQVPPAKYIPIRVGENSFSSNITTYRSFDAAGQFEDGIINTGASNTRIAVADSAVDALNIKVNNWGVQNGWSIFDLMQAAKSGNWDLVTAKEKARKRNWDLGIQRVAFLGARGQNGVGGQCLGLLNQAGITFDTGLVTQSLSSMTPTQLNVFQQNSIKNYRINNNYTAYPSAFVIPEDDFNGLASQSSEDFPIKSKLALLEEAFQVVCMNPKFKILPLAYASAANAGGVLPALAATALYTFLNYDDESIRMDIPLDYTNTLANSLDNFMFQNAAYGQFTGVLAYRPAELYYAGY